MASMKSSLQARWMVASTATALVLWTVLRPWLPKSELAENSFQANRIRLQAWQLDARPSAVLVGSSLTGRLLPTYFRETPLKSMGNLGLDGSGPELGFRLLLQCSNVPPLVLVEGHRLSKRWGTNDGLLLQELDSLSTRLARRVPAFRAEMRPSSMLYSWVKQHSKGGSVRPESSRPGGPVEEPEPGWEQRQEEYIRQLRNRGADVRIFRLPAGRENLRGPNDPDIIGDLARKWGLPYLQIEQECRRRGIELHYTDGLHLSPDSARTVSAVLAELANRPAAP